MKLAFLIILAPLAFARIGIADAPSKDFSRYEFYDRLAEDEPEFFQILNDFMGRKSAQAIINNFSRFDKMKQEDLLATDDEGPGSRHRFTFTVGQVDHRLEDNYEGTAEEIGKLRYDKDEYAKFKARLEEFNAQQSAIKERGETATFTFERRKSVKPSTEKEGLYQVRESYFVEVSVVQGLFYSYSSNVINMSQIRSKGINDKASNLEIISYTTTHPDGTPNPELSKVMTKILKR